MYGIALTTQACLNSGTEVQVAWAVSNDVSPVRDPNEALALTPGGGRVGGVLAGAANDQLADASRTCGEGRVVTTTINEYEAALAGLARGGTARCVVMPASRLPERLWSLLLNREPLALVLEVDGDAVTGSRVVPTIELDTLTDGPDTNGPDTALADQLRALTRSGRATTEVTAERIVSVFVPVPTLVLVGGGPMIDAMEQLGGFLGWQVQRAFDPARATDLVVGLSPLDKLVVSGHDVEVAGPVLMAALRSRVGYIGALGGRPAQLALRDWLAVRGVDDDSAIYGPAGLDLGATSPQEVALSVLGQAIAVGTGRSGGPL